MATGNRKNIMYVLVAGSVCVVLPRSQAIEPNVDVVGEAHAKGITVLRATFPSRGEVWRLTLRTSEDGREFREAGVGRLGVPDLYRSIAYNEETTAVLVPAFGWFGTDMSFFGEEGTYWFRWSINFRDDKKARTVPDQLDKGIEPVKVEQIVQVKRARPADLDFIAGLGGEDLARYMFGQDFFERDPDATRERLIDPEIRAVMVIGRLLSATRARTADSVKLPKGDLQKAADALLTLAMEIPDSSYAPYAAYYAGCCYFRSFGESMRERMKGMKEADKLAMMASGSKKSRYIRKAEAALALAARDGDAYLKPRAICMSAGLPALAGAWDEAERLFDEALAVGGDRGTIQKMVDRARRDMAHAKKRISKSKRDDDK